MGLRTYSAGGVLVLMMSVMAFGQTAKPTDAPQSKPAAPAFSLISVDGKKLELTSLRGKVVVLNFWFTGCPPCVAEMPELNSLVDEFKDEDVVFIAPTWDDEATVRTFLKERSFKYQVVPKAGDMILGSYSDGAGNVSFPMHFIIDKDGRIETKLAGALVTKEGAQKLDDFRDTIKRLVTAPRDKTN